jgi:hypothetical protein
MVILLIDLTLLSFALSALVCRETLQVYSEKAE